MFSNRNSNERKIRNGKNLLVGLSAGGLIYAVIHLFHIITSIQHINESQKEDKFKNAKAYIIITDSVTGKRDSLLLSDYLQNKNQNRDTLSKQK